MALVSDGFKLSVTVTDKSASDSTLTFNLTSADYLGATTDAAAVLAALANVTDSEVRSYRIYEAFIEDALALPASAQNAEKASVTLQSTTAGKKVNLRIPAPNDGVFTSTSGPGNNVVNVSSVALGAYVDLFTATGVATISDGDVVAATPASILSGRRVTVRSSNP